MMSETERERMHSTRLAMMGGLFTSVVHDVLQPISACIVRGRTAVRWLQRPTPDVAEATAAIEKLIADAERAIAVVTQFRKMAAKGAGTPEPVVLNTMLRDCLQWLDHEFQRHRVELNVHLSAGHCCVWGERVLLQQVVMNLLVNAIQAMVAAPGRRLLCVDLIRTGSGADSHAVFSVQDSGEGIADAAMLRLFQAFHTTRPDGIGVGLSICQTIVSAHGGRIWAERPRGGGARFVVQLPLHEGHEGHEGSGGSAPA